MRRLWRLPRAKPQAERRLCDELPSASLEYVYNSSVLLALAFTTILFLVLVFADGGEDNSTARIHVHTTSVHIGLFLTSTMMACLIYIEQNVALCRNCECVEGLTKLRV